MQDTAGVNRDGHTIHREQEGAFVVLMKRHYPASLSIPGQEGCCCILTVNGTLDRFGQTIEHGIRLTGQRERDRSAKVESMKWAGQPLTEYERIKQSRADFSPVDRWDWDGKHG